MYRLQKHQGRLRWLTLKHFASLTEAILFVECHRIRRWRVCQGQLVVL